MKNNEITAEVRAEIEHLIKMAEQNEAGTMITSSRYAVKGNMAFDNKKGYVAIEVTRYINNYGSDIVSVTDVIDDCPMYSKDAIIKAGLTPVSEREIAKFGKITKIVIDDQNGRRTYNF